MPLTSYGEPQMLQALFGATTTGIPSNYYVGLITSSRGVYSSTNTFTPTIGDIVIPSNFATAATNKIYRCVATSGSACSGTATFNTGSGAYTQDAGSSTTWWQETTPYFYGTVAVLSASSGTSASTTSLTIAQGSTQATGTPLTTALPTGTALTITSPTGTTKSLTTSGTPTAGSGGTYAGGGSNYGGATTLSIASADFSGGAFAIGSTISLASSTSGYYATEVANSNNYARQTVSNTQGLSGFATPQSPSPFVTSASVSTAGSTTNFVNAVSFPNGSTSSGSWNYVCGFFLASSISQGAGNAYAWNTLSNYVPLLTSGMQITLPGTTGITVTLA